MLINEDWYKKQTVQSKAETPRVTRISADSTTLLFKEDENIKVRVDGLKSHMQVLQDIVGKVLQLHKDSSINIGKL